MATRCFVALPLPQKYQEALPEIASAWDAALRSKLKWTTQGNWHLTIFFLGELEPDVLFSVQNVLHTVDRHRFQLQAGGAGFFPAHKTPRVLWVGLRQGARECVQLAKDVESALLPLGFTPSKRPFRPHLTLARIKRPGSDDWSSILQWLQQKQWPSFEVDRFVLYASRLTAKGPEYRVINEYFLTGSEK